ncbi:MAG: hypothetical protein V7K27_01495 [Nostoc sp.]|uniref:hypothetical protein n=1 Tax=Nostoc sp. TaxID=1180 RepID=UPI002FFCF7A0
MHISLRHLSEADFDFIHEVTKAAMQTYSAFQVGEVHKQSLKPVCKSYFTSEL